MKQKLLNNLRLRAVWLVAMILCAVTGAWADEVTYTFTANSWTATSGGNAANWTAGKNGAGFSNNGIQVTTSATGANGTSPEEYSNISKIVVTYNTNKSAGAGSIDVKIGNNDATSNNVAFSGSADGRTANFTTEYNYDAPQSGAVKLTVNTTTNSIYLVSVAITYSSGGGSSAVSTSVTIDASDITNTNVFEGTDAGSLAATVKAGEDAIEGAAVTWSGNNDDVATINTTTGAVTLVAAGSVTFTASYAGVENTYKPSSKTYTMTVTNSDPNAPGTENNPYTVAQARAAIDAGTGVTGVYATGIVSEIVTAYSSQFHNISYNISADGLTTSDQLQAYRGKSYNGDNFTSEDDIQVGDVVVVYGNLTKYSSTYEFAQDNQLVSLVRKPAAPTFSPIAGAVASGTEVTLSTTTQGATIYYTIDGTDPTSSSTEYTEAIEITEATTIKAIAVKETLSSDVATAAYTIAAAVDTPTFSPEAGTYNAAQTVTISCGTAGATIYYSFDNEVWTEYTEALNINESKTVYAKAEKEGSVTSYANAAYTLEIPAITFVDATPKNLTYEAQNYDFAFTGAYTTGSFAVVVCDYEGNAKTYDWFSAELIEDAVRVTLTQNEDTKNSRTAYFKVTADNATSEVFQVEQNALVVDYATLPFSWAGGASADLKALDGVTANGLGSDYASGHAPYLVKLDGTGDYIQVKTDGRPGVASIEVKMIGGANTSTITVQESNDGENFTNVENLEISGALNTTLNLSTTNDFASDSRFVRFYFTKGSNVGVGPISITKYSSEPSIIAENVELTFDATSGEIAYTIKNPVESEELTASTEAEWISNLTVDSENNKVTFTTTANNGTERSATITLNYASISKNITVTQAEFIYAALPFIWDDNTTPVGVENSGVATYGGSPYMKFDGTGDYLILTLNEVPGTLTFDIQGNGFSGGTFKVQTSVDGKSYSDLETYTELTSTKQSQSFDLSSDVRYIKWIYTEKVSGNVALGNFVLTAPITVTLNDYGFATFASTYPLDFTNTSDYDSWQVTGVQNTAISFEKIESKVAAGTGVLLTGYANETITLTRASSGSALSGNKLEGITEATEVAADTYFGLKGNEFVKVNAGTIAAGKAVLPTSVLPAGVKSFTFNFNGVPTGVNGFETVDAENARIFNLAGQRLSAPQKGLNIVNGKKVLVK